MNEIAQWSSSTYNLNFWQGDIPWVSSSDIGESSIYNVDIKKYISKNGLEQSATKLCPKNSILLVTRVGVGKVAIAPTSICTSQDFTNIIETKENTNFLALYLKQKMDRISQASQGTSIKGITTSDIKNILINLPPLAEQEKIAAILSKQDELIELQAKIIAEKQVQKKGLMQSLLTAKQRLKGFSGKWEKKKLGDCFAFFSGGTPPTQRKDYYSGDIPFIRSAEIDKKGTELFISEEAMNNSSARLVQIGDLLVSLYGANSGETAICKINGAINQAVLCIRSQLESITFLYYILIKNKDLYVSKYLQGVQGNFSAKIVKSFEIAFPSLAEQEAIAAVLNAADKEIEILQAKLEEEKRKKKALMQMLLTGKVRVKV